MCTGGKHGGFQSKSCDAGSCTIRNYRWPDYPAEICRWECVNSGSHREVAENYALLRYHAASSDNFVPTFRDNISVPFSVFKNLQDSWLLNPDDGTDNLSRNVDKKLPLLAAQKLRGARFSCRWKYVNQNTPIEWCAFCDTLYKL